MILPLDNSQFKVVNKMDFPKLVIASDGHSTGALLDGVFIGKGIERLEFSSENKDGKPTSTLRLLDLDVGLASLEIESETHGFSKLMEGMAGIEKAVFDWADTAK